MKIKVGLFAGGIEQYWTETGMYELPGVLKADVKRLTEILGKEFEVVYPGFAGNVAESRKIGKAIREENVDMAIIYHATYLDDAMTMGFLDELSDTFTVLFHSQGFKTFTEPMDLTGTGRSWGNNSIVQIHGTFKRLRPDFRYGFVFGAFDNPRAIVELKQYACAARAVKNLKGKRIGYLPHRSIAVPMYDTFPDDAKMMGQTGVEIDFLYIIDLLKEIQAVSDKDAEALTNRLYEKYEVVEPPREEILQSARVSLGLERLVENNNIDALAIDFAYGMVPHIGAMPCVAMSLLSDKGVVVSSEGDLSVAVAGLLTKNITGRQCHFWEHLGFDEENNWIIGGHEGGSAGFALAKDGTKPKLRNTQYIDFSQIPDSPLYGVLPEFITNPGPVTLITFFRDTIEYEMRIACGESVDLDPFEIHYEHTVFKPEIPLNDYFKQIAKHGICHHYALTHADIKAELLKIAEILKMKAQCLTDL